MHACILICLDEHNNYIFHLYNFEFRYISRNVLDSSQCVNGKACIENVLDKRNT